MDTKYTEKWADNQIKTFTLCGFKTVADVREYGDNQTLTPIQAVKIAARMELASLESAMVNIHSFLELLDETNL